MPSLRNLGGKHYTRLQFAELIWLICNRNILEFLCEVPRERQLAVRFEDLVSEPETSIQQVCRFLDLEYDAAILQPYDNQRARMTEGLHKESRMLGDLKFHNHKIIDDTVAECWKREYDADFLGNVTWDVARQFGYSSIQEATVKPKAQDESVITKVLSAEEQLLARINELSDEDVERELEKMLTNGNGD
jgi:hypothetical protein